MIPHSFPTQVSSNTGRPEMIVYYLGSIVGLTRWVDYIPVRTVQIASELPTENTTNSAGFEAVSPLTSTTGLNAWRDYVPVYEDGSATVPFTTDANGYIPVGLSGAGGASLVLNFAYRKALDSRITFTRASSATYFDANGVLQYATGSELVTGSAYAVPGGFDNTVTVVSASSFTANPGTTNSRVYHNIATVSGQTYKIEYQCTAISSSTVQLFAKNAANGGGSTLASGATVAAGGRDILFFTANSTTSSLLFASLAVGASFTVTGVTTKQTSDIPRFDHDPVTRICKGLLIEEARTNLFLRSEEFDSASWSKTNVTVTGAAINAVTSPAGTLTADKIEESVTGSAVAHSISQGATASASTAYTLSFYAKVGERNRFRVWLRGALSSNRYEFGVNLSTGAIFSAQTTGLFTSPSSSVTAVGNGWYRIVASATTGAGETSVSLVLSILDDVATVAAGDHIGVVGYGLYIWGAQLEAGSFPTSYIPTTTATATRSADVASMTGTNFSSWWNASEGTFVASFYRATTGQNNALVRVDDGSVNNRHMLWINTSNQLGAVHSSGGVTTTAPVSVNTHSSYSNGAYVYSVSGVTVCLNGGAVPTSDTNNNPLSGMTRAFIGANDAGNVFNGHIAKLAFYPKKLSDSILRGLTS